MCIAVLIAPNIFTFGELLNQNIFHVLFQNESTKWMGDLLKSFENGN